MKTSVKAWFIFLMVTAYNKEYLLEQHTDITYDNDLELPYLCRIFANKFCISGCWNCSFTYDGDPSCIAYHDGNQSCIAYRAIHQMRNIH